MPHFTHENGICVALAILLLHTLSVTCQTKELTGNNTSWACQIGNRAEAVVQSDQFNSLVNLEWRKNGVLIKSNDPHYKITSVEGKMSKLTIQRVVSTDFEVRNWTFSANNQDGVEHSINFGPIKELPSIRGFIVDEDAKTIIRSSISKTEGSSLTLQCVITKNITDISNLKLVWFFKHESASTYVPISENQTKTKYENDTIRLTQLANANRGLYNCSMNYTDKEYGKLSSSFDTFLRVKSKYGALWPFIGILVEVALLVALILICERRQKQHRKATDENAIEEEKLANNAGTVTGADENVDDEEFGPFARRRQMRRNTGGAGSLSKFSSPKAVAGGGITSDASSSTVADKNLPECKNDVVLAVPSTTTTDNNSSTTTNLSKRRLAREHPQTIPDEKKDVRRPLPERIQKVVERLSAPKQRTLNTTSSRAMEKPAERSSVKMVMSKSMYPSTSMKKKTVQSSMTTSSIHVTKARVSSSHSSSSAEKESEEGVNLRTEWNLHAAHAEAERQRLEEAIARNAKIQAEQAERERLERERLAENERSRVHAEQERKEKLAKDELEREERRRRINALLKSVGADIDFSLDHKSEGDSSPENASTASILERIISRSNNALTNSMVNSATAAATAYHHANEQRNIMNGATTTTTTIANASTTDINFNAIDISSAHESDDDNSLAILSSS